MVTIKDIARISGYGIGTVSRVINKQPSVSDKARRRIEEVIDELQFERNTSAQFLKQQKGSDITIVITGNGNPLFSDILEQIQSKLEERGEDTSVVFVDELADPVSEAVRICTARKPKGLIFLGGMSEHFRNSFGKINVPAVLLTNTGESLDFKNLSSFATDDYTASREAVRYLIENGHQHIGVIGGFLEEESFVRRRLKAVEDEMREHGLEFYEKDNYLECRFSVSAGYESARVLLDKNPGMTAVYALGDSIAMGLIRALHDMHRRVPEDISVIGFDGIEMGRYFTPRLCTMKQDTGILAEKGVQTLMNKLYEDTESSPVHEMIGSHFIRGESVRNLNGTNSRVHY